MEKIMELQQEIERNRPELNKAYKDAKYEIYYQLSIKMDALIEQYIEMKEQPYM